MYDQPHVADISCITNVGRWKWDRVLQRNNEEFQSSRKGIFRLWLEPKRKRRKSYAFSCSKAGKPYRTSWLLIGTALEGRNSGKGESMLSHCRDDYFLCLFSMTESGSAFLRRWPLSQMINLLNSSTFELLQ